MFFGQRHHPYSVQHSMEEAIVTEDFPPCFKRGVAAA